MLRWCCLSRYSATFNRLRLEQPPIETCVMLLEMSREQCRKRKIGLFIELLYSECSQLLN
jgi:hypothetical protein